MKKRIIALLTVLVLVISLSATAMAAKPTANLLAAYRNQTVARGKSITFVFKVNSGTYTKSGKVFRAKMDTQITKKIDGKSKILGVATWQFTGSQKYSLTTSVSKKAVTGKYTLRYTTYYRSKATSKWQKAKTYTDKFTVK